MQPEIQRKLHDINRSFYGDFAQHFADARSPAQASLRQALQIVRSGDAVLDAGCGDGRMARALDDMGVSATYLGVDSSENLLALARRRCAGLVHVRASFRQSDLAESGWSAILGGQRFAVVLTLAVLHHLPGAVLRQQVMCDLAAVLAPGGRVVVSTWQFMSVERLRRKVVPWSAAGIDPSQVDDGDYLLTWQRGGLGVRYVHLVDEGALRGLFAQAGLAVDDAWLADHGLNLFLVGHACQSPPAVL